MPDTPQPGPQHTLVMNTPDAGIQRAPQTVSEYLAKHGLAGGVQLEPDPAGSSTTAAALLADDQGRKYDVSGTIATGGMGAVLRAADLNCRRAVAMKVMLPERTATPGLAMRFVEEAQITAQLEHPNIVPVHELGVDASGNVFYTMKLVKGVTLKMILDRIAEGHAETVAKYPLSQLLTILLKTCDAMAFAHAKGVIHRDLKPENIMVGEFGEVLLMDWGLAKVLGQPTRDEAEAAAAAPRPDAAVASARYDSGDASLRTMEGRVMGTPAYMPPEQAMGKVAQLDARSDIYSLGGILYTILTLRQPVTGKNPQDVLKNVVHGRIVPPTEFDTDSEVATRPAASPEAARAGVRLAHLPGGRVPAALAAVAMKALAPKQNERYASVQELQRELEAYLHGFATRAERASPATQLWLLLKRHKAVAGVLLAALLLLAAGAVFHYQQVTRERNDAYAAREIACQEEASAKVAKEELAAVSRKVAPEFLAKARSCMDHRQWPEALAAARIAAQLDDRSCEAAFLVGQLQLAAHAYEAAGRSLEAAARLTAPNSALSRSLAAHRRVATDMHTLLRQGGNTEKSKLALALAKAFVQLQQPLLAARLYAEAGVQDVPGTSVEDLQISAAVERLTELNPKLRRTDFTVGFGDGGRAFTCHAPGLVDLAPLTGVKLNVLDLSESGVAAKSLTALQQVPVTTLSLAHTGIVDLRPLKGLKLQHLSLAATSVTDLAPLAGQPLATLDLSDTQVADLTPLKGMPLQRLIITKTFVASLAAVAGAPLAELLAANTPLTSLAPLKGCPLRKLDVMFASEIREVTALKGAPLTELDLTGTQVSDLGPLQGAPLKVLSLWNTPVSSLVPLRGAPLAKLNLEATKVTDLTPLRGMPLSRLNIAGTPVTSIAPLSGMPLTALELRGTKVGDLGPLQKMPLRELGLAYVPATDFAPLAGLPLTALDLRGTRLTDLTAIAGCPLRELVLAFTAVENLGPLKGMPLQKLDLRGTKVSDLAVLKGMPLTELCLAECSRLTDLRVLADLKTLVKLALPPNARNLDPVRGLPNLKVLANNGDDFDRGLSAAEFWRQADKR